MTMSVEADLLELERLAAASSPESDSLAALTTIPAIYAFLITCARHDGDDEADTAELFARHSGATAAEARATAETLRRLGYGVAAKRLFQIAGRRKHGLAPL
jgi:hypothetical protein